MCLVLICVRVPVPCHSRIYRASCEECCPYEPLLEMTMCLGHFFEGHRTEVPSHRIVVSLIAVSGADLVNGMMFGWTAVLPKLQEDTSRFTVTEDDVSWLVSVVLIMGFITAPLAGPIAECVGPRRLLMIITLPVTGLWLVQAYSPYLWLLYLARALMAICGTVVYTVVNPLAAELFPAHIRGVATAVPEAFGSAGLLLSYLLASVLPWDTATAFFAVPILPLSFMMLLVPESPYWLVRKNNIDAAERFQTSSWP
ncbi:facilitated trehalose transporter Tret1-like [Penaeus indicus]|uniref:facilitated trehalose transporter Tret1-like n=1 Tax=Penaeus indicus TaxID=29960 RepID=UPI00300C831C